MTEEIMTIEETTNTEEVKDYYEAEETSSNGNLGAIALIGGLVIGGAAAVLHFTKAKREAWRDRRLEKKGYVKLKPGEYVVCGEVDDSEEVEETE